MLFNVIWRVHKPRTVLQRFLTYWAVLTIGPIILGASLSLTYYLVSFSLGYVRHTPCWGRPHLKLLPVALMSLAFTLLYLAVPNRYVPWKHALVGGVFAGIAFELMKRVFAWYISSFPTYTLVYGAFATFPIFYCGFIFLAGDSAGAVIAAALSHWRGGTWQLMRAPGWQFEAALRLLQALAEAQRAGHSVKLAWLSQHVDLGLDEMEPCSIGWRKRISCVAPIRMLGCCCARRRKSTADVFRLFVFDAKSKAQRTTPIKPCSVNSGSNTKQRSRRHWRTCCLPPEPLVKEE